MYEVDNVKKPQFIGYENNRDFTNTSLEFDAGDLGPSDVIFMPSTSAPTNDDYVVVANSISATLTVYRIDRLDASPDVPLPSVPTADASSLSLFSGLIVALSLLLLAF